MLNYFGTTAPTLDVQGLTDNVTLQGIFNVIQPLLPIVATAILVGVVFYTLRWAIGMFRGI